MSTSAASSSILESALEASLQVGGTPAYVYALPLIEERCLSLTGALQDLFALSFAVKANPNPSLLTRLRATLPYLDISSSGELSLALAAGFSADQRYALEAPRRPRWLTHSSAG